ncbi:MAG: uracil-DNA glycosylase [Mariprofundus sp.]
MDYADDDHADPTALIAPTWDKYLAAEFGKPYMQELQCFLQAQQSAIYPPASQWYEAFRQTPFEQVKVVILGQDPYHGPGQAHGLSFSVPRGKPVPPSLRNIYQELHTDLDIAPPSHGYLQAWATQGVLLLNSTLTVAQNNPAAHQNQGWEIFTDKAMQALNDHREHLVFMLWGKAAQNKGKMLDHSRHLILTAPHPSPLSSYRGFFGCRHFSQANAWLQAHAQTPVDWRLP